MAIAVTSIWVKRCSVDFSSYEDHAFADRKEQEMEKISKKKSVLAIVLATIMGLLATTTVITTASGCLVCRDCGPKQPFNNKK